jgi:hypothetical protein
MRRLRPAALAALAVLATLASGCGGGSDEPASPKEQVAAAITKFNKAFADGDGSTACKLITDEYRQSIELGHQSSCEKAVAEEAGPSGAEHEQVEVLGKAQVVNVQIVGEVGTGDVVGPGLDSGPPAQAQRQGGKWLVSATAWGSL